MSSIPNDIFHNPLFMSAAAGWFTAQVIKFFIYAWINHTFRLERLIGDGGMPSAHSATVCALAVSSACVYGFGSSQFAICAFFAIIVMHDAKGVRLETGRQAMVLNEIIDLYRSAGQNLTNEEKLKEFVGHTPFQVLCGGILGAIIGLIFGTLIY